MSIECGCNARSLATTVACVLAMFVTACGGGSDQTCGDLVCDAGETASGCPEDCGCGNRVLNPGEECDGPDVGGATCMGVTNQGGTLRCNSNCTFDVAACTLASCGNGVAEEGEVCDGNDLKGRTCASIGYGGGTVGCSVDCSFDTEACCSNTCPAAGMTDCIGDSLRECAMTSSGCLAWQVTNCAANGNVCDSATGTATCHCVDRCAAVGDQRCEGATIETCGDVGGCLDWSLATNCGTGGDLCAVAPSGPLCVPDASAEDCSDPYPLSPGDNVVAWTALNADYLTSQPSCETTSMDGPDLVLAYTAPEDGFVSFTLHKPASQRQSVVVSKAECGTVTPELACVSDFSPTSLTTQFPVEMGQKYHVYVRDTTSGSAPLDNPLLVTLDETLCSALSPSVATLSPANSLSIPDLTPVFSANFDYPIDPTQGVITVTGNMGSNFSYDLATGPGEVAILNANKTIQIDTGIVFPLGESVTVSWTGLRDATCTKPIAPPTWTVNLTGPPYSVSTGTTAYADACVGGTVQTITSVDEDVTDPFAAPAGFKFFGQPVTQLVASTNGWLSVDPTTTSAVFSNVAMPNTANPNGVIGAYWDDLDDIAICTKMVGNKLVVQWNGDLFSSSSTLIQFQAILDPTDNSIEYVYGANQQADGSSATIGVEDQAGVYAVQSSFNAAGSVTPSTSKKFTPN
jgi:hypothetical protein